MNLTPAHQRTIWTSMDYSEKARVNTTEKHGYSRHIWLYLALNQIFNEFGTVKAIKNAEYSLLN